LPRDDGLPQAIADKCGSFFRQLEECDRPSYVMQEKLTAVMLELIVKNSINLELTRVLQRNGEVGVRLEELRLRGHIDDVSTLPILLRIQNWFVVRFGSKKTRDAYRLKRMNQSKILRKRE